MDRRSVLVGLGATGLATKAMGKPPTSPVGRTTAGQVRGYLDGSIKAFKGIRYGAPPRRFQPPAAPLSWTGIAQATDFGPGSPQRSDEAHTAEDCLFLNLWTPGLDAGRRPVMVYIHGGAYSNGSGSSPLYDGRRLAERGDVVVVTLNHRLNAFGHLYLHRLGPGFEDSGNAGMLDLILALTWVRDNIDGFGGDPGKVMLFGQSGGGAKIATLMAMPVAADLFHRAATMSGQQLTASGPGNATRRAQAMLARLGMTPQQAAEAPAERLVEALSTVDPVIGSGGLYMCPVLDERTLTRHPFYPDAPPQSAGIPMMIGNTHDETRGLIGKSDPSSFNLTWDELPARLGPQLRVDIDPELVVTTYRGLYPAYSPSDVFFAATTASRSWRAAVVEAELRAQQGSPAFAYQLDWGSPQDGGKWGAPHTLDIPLVFGTLDAAGSITGTAADAKAVSQAMQDAFLAFARSGDPGWAPYTLPQRRTMIFNAVSAMADDPRGAERRLFAKVPFIQQGT